MNKIEFIGGDVLAKAVGPIYRTHQIFNGPIFVWELHPDGTITNCFIDGMVATPEELKAERASWLKPVGRETEPL